MVKTKSTQFASGTSHLVRSTVSRWLKWDGTYTFRGNNNKLIGAIDTPCGFDEEPLQARLRRLGFHCQDPADSKFIYNTWHALKQLQGYTEASDAGSARQVFARFVPPGTGDSDALRADILAMLWNAGAPTHLNAALAKLDSRFLEKWSHKGVSSGAAMRVQIHQGPTQIIPFRESGAFKVQISGFDAASTLMIRVFRNQGHNPKVDHHWKGLVYQEILDAGDIRALPEGKPDADCRIRHEGAREALHLEKMTLGLGAFSRLHAPYKFEVWIAADANAFHALMPAESTPAPADLACEVQQTRAQGYFVPADGVPEAPAHAFNEEEDGATEIAMADRTAGAYAFFGTPCEGWAEQGGTIFHTCGLYRQNELKHVPRLETQPIPSWFDELNPYVRTITDQAQTEYTRLWQKAKAKKQQSCQHNCPPLTACQQPTTCQARNWSFPEIETTFGNVERHTRQIEQSFCCGFASDLDPAYAKGASKDQVRTVTERVRNQIAALRQQEYPYQKCMELLARWAAVIDFVTYRTLVQPEEAHWSKLYAGRSRSDAINLGRNNSESWRTATDAGQIQAGHAAYGDGDTIVSVFDARIPAEKRGSDCYPDAIAVPEIIFVPSYNWLDYMFFVKTRTAPIFVVALADFKTMIADSIYMSPYDFFNHDLFHIVDFPGNKGQLWETMRVGLEAYMSTPIDGRTVEMEHVLEFWDANLRSLHRSMQPLYVEVKALETDLGAARGRFETAEQAYEQAIRDQDVANDNNRAARSAAALDAGMTKNTRSREFLAARTAYEEKSRRLKALEALLFTIVHEPVTSSNFWTDHKDAKLPSLLEKDSIRFRMFALSGRKDAQDRPLRSGLFRAIHTRYRQGFFGRPEPFGGISSTLVDEIQAAIDCPECQEDTPKKLMNFDRPTGCHWLHQEFPKSDYWEQGAGCAKGWILAAIDEWPTFESWFRDRPQVAAQGENN